VRRVTLILFFIALYGNLSETFSWDSTAAKYYPLNIGNIWVYSSFYTFFDSTIFAGYHRHVVTNDSIFNGHRYYKVNPLINGCNNLRYERIDSSSMNVYRWDPVYSRDILIDSLLARKNNTFKGYRNCSNTNNIAARCSDTNLRYVLGNQIKSKSFDADGLVLLQYTLSENIGVSSYFQSEGNFWGSTLEGCIINGVLYGDTSTVIVGINQVSSEVPEKFSLSQNYPNPFNPATNLKFEIPRAGFTKLTVFDILGKEVQILLDEQLYPGIYEIDFDGSSLPSGVYYYKLESGSFTETKKMILLK
jgi:hypothetical protein